MRKTSLSSPPRASIIRATSAAREAADVAALRGLPGVVDAYTTNMYPMQGGGWIDTVTLTPDQKTPTAVTANYMGDEHALNTMGLKLIAGRNFTATEIETKRPPDDPPYSGLIVSKMLAEKVFPNGNALGKMIYFRQRQTRADHRHRRAAAGPDDRRHRLVRTFTKSIRCWLPII